MVEAWPILVICTLVVSFSVTFLGQMFAGLLQLSQDHRSEYFLGGDDFFIHAICLSTVLIIFLLFKAGQVVHRLAILPFSIKCLDCKREYHREVLKVRKQTSFQLI